MASALKPSDKPLENISLGSAVSLSPRLSKVESGSRNDRPQLKAAIELCKRQRATLIIAQLDRRARNVAFISTLMEAGIAFIAADLSHANKLIIHMLAAFAEHERDKIRARTKAALAAAKARGLTVD